MRSRRRSPGPAGETGPLHRRGKAGDAGVAGRSRGGALTAIAEAARRLGNAALGRLLGRSTVGTEVDPGLAARLGASYGTDLTGARVVDDPEARAAADALSARAFVVGDTVFLGSSAPPRSSPAGEELLAHELAHVAQQRTASQMREGDVGVPGDPHERAAAAGARAAVRGEQAAVTPAAAPAAIQPDQADPLMLRKRGKSRAEARAMLDGYFTRVRAAQGGTSVRVNEDVKLAVQRIGTNLDLDARLRLDAWTRNTIFPGSPAELAEQVARLLPEPVDEASLAHLASLPHSAAPKGKVGRLVDLVKSTEPSLSAEQQEKQWAFDRMVSESRRNDPALLGPLKAVTPSIDLQRAWNVGKGLPGALKGPGPPKVEAQSFDEVEGVIATIDAAALAPAEVAGTDQAGEYVADAREVGRALARDLDIAQQKKNYTVELRLGANYAKVKDPVAIYEAVERIIRLVRDALPHHASQVGIVELYFGDKLVRRVSLGGGR